MLDVREGDVVFHLCGDSDHATFSGVSLAASSAILTNSSPDAPRDDYRVDLREYTPLQHPFSPRDLFDGKSNKLTDYFIENRAKSANAKERLFYVFQNRKLQCLNGAYLSFLSDALVEIIFGIQLKSDASKALIVTSDTTTDEVLRVVGQRIGQQKFSENVKNNYNNRCCFPNCEAKDSRFLVGSHIARWADAENLRGKTENGLCLCTFHDRAFEVGAFSLSDKLSVKIGKVDPSNYWLLSQLSPMENEPIAQPIAYPPSERALNLHRKRHGIP